MLTTVFTTRADAALEGRLSVPPLDLVHARVLAAMKIFLMSGSDGSGEVHTGVPWTAFGGHVPPGGSNMYWFDQSRGSPAWTRA